MSAKITIKLRRDTGTNWDSVNPVLANGEAGFNATTNQIKIGDGTNTWANLAYLSAAAGSSLISGNSNVVIDASGGNLLVAVTGNANVMTANANLVWMSALTANGNSQFNQDLSVSGNLTVVGTLNYFTIANVTVSNPIVYVNDAGANNLVDVGLVGQYATGGNTYYTGIARDHSDGTWKVFEHVPTKPASTVDWANAQLANFKAGDITATGNITVTSNITGNNITANYFYGDGSNLSNVAAGNAIVNGTSNAVVTINGNINVSVAGNANVVTFTDVGVTAAALEVTGTSNLGAIGNVTITGGSNNQFIQTDGSGVLSFGDANVSKIANGISQISIPAANGNIQIDAAGTANAIVVSASNVEITGNVAVSANVTANVITANLLTGTLDVNSNAQPNITSLGTLSNLSVDGNVVFANGSVTLGDIGNIHMTGGNSGELLSTDGSGNLSWISPTAQTIDAWALTNSYSIGKLVRYQGALWSANDVIPTNTAFTIGTSGATWSPVDQLTGLNTITTASYSTSTTLNASTTVDVATALNIPQATSGISLTLPTPTLSTQPRTLIVNNTGVASVLVKGYTLNPGWSVMALWTGTVWQLAVPDPNTATWSFLDDSSGVSFSGLSGTAFTQNVAIATTATSNVSAGANGFLTGVLSGTGRYTVVGGGNVIHSGNLVYTGNTTIGTNTLMTFTGNGRLGGGSYSNVINAQGTLNYQAANNQTLSGVISGVGGVTMNAAGQTMTITSNSTYTGNTKVFDGNLSIGSGSSGGLLANASNLYVYGNANAHGTLAFRTNYGNSQTISMASNFFGNGNVFFNGPNIASNGYYNIDAATYTSFSGNWIVSGARIVSNHALAASRVYVSGNGAQWYVSGGNAWTNDWYLSGNGFNETTPTFGALRIEQANASALSGNVNISGTTLIRTANSAGNVTFSGNLNADTGSANTIVAANVAIYYSTTNTAVGYTLNWANANNSGITGLVQGAFNANSVNAFGNLSTLTMGEGQAVNLVVNANANAGGLSGSYTNANTNVAANTTFTFGGNDSNTTYVGTISGSGGLTKVGNGTTRITANASYTGLTTINRGRLIFGNGTATWTPGTGNIVLSVANASANSDAISTVRFDTNAATPTIVRTFIGNGNVEFYGTAETTAGQSQYQIGNGFANFNGNVVINTGAYVKASNVVFSNAAANGIVTVASNAQLVVDTTANFYSPITLNGNGMNVAGGPEGALVLQANANVTGDITLAGNSYITTRSLNGTISGNITGANFNVRLTANAGTTPTLILSGSNSNWANTTIYGASNGGVVVNNSGAIPGNTVMTISNGGGNVMFVPNANVSIGSLAGNTGVSISGSNANYTLTTGNLNSNTTYSGTIAGNVNFEKLGNGTQTLDGNSTTTGNFTSSNGIIQFGSGGNSGAPGNGFLVTNDPGTIKFFRNDTGLNITSGLAGNGNISFLGNGTANTSTYTLTSSNATGFTGWINVEANAKLTANSAYGANIQGVNVKSNGQLYVSGVANFYNRIDAIGSGWLEANSSRLGALRMSASSNVRSNINLISANNLANSTVMISLDATTGNANLLGNIQLGTLANANTAANVGVEYNSNGGELFLRYASANYDGETKITGTGSVTAQVGTAIPANGNVLINGGATFKANANLDTSSGLLYGAGNLNIADNTLVYQFGGANRSTPTTSATFSGAWTGAGSIEKVGTGNIVFTGTSTANGTVTVTTGTLTIGNSTLQSNANVVGLGANAIVSVANGATLNYVRDGNANAVSLSQRFRGNGDIKFWGTNATSGNTIFAANAATANSDFSGNVYLGNFTLLYAANNSSGGVLANARNLFIANGSSMMTRGTNANITSNIYATGIGAPYGGNTGFYSPIYFNSSNATISGNIYLDGDTNIQSSSGDTLSNIAGVIQNNANVTTANITFLTGATDRITLNTAATYSGNTTLSTNAQVWGSVTNALPVNTIVTISNGAVLTVNANMTIGHLTSNGNGTAQTAGTNANFTLNIGNSNNSSTFDGNLAGNINYNIISSNTKLTLTKGDVTTTGTVKVTKGVLQLGNSTTTGEITAASLVNVAFGGNLVYFRSNNSTAASSSRQFTGAGNIVYGTTANVANGNANYSITSWNSSSNFSGNIYVYNANIAVGTTVGNVAGLISAANCNSTIFFTGGTNNNKITVNGVTNGWYSSTGTQRGTISLSASTVLNGAITIADDANPNANLVVNAVANMYFYTLAGGTANINGNITGNGELVLSQGIGSNSTHTIRLSGTSNYTGNTTLQSFVNVALAGNGGFSPNTSVSIANTAILTYENANANIGSLAAGNSNTGARVTSGNANAVLTIGNDNKSTVFYGQLNGTGKFTKIGNGTQTFDGTNGITGNITISNGTIQVSNASSSGQLAGANANITVNLPGTLTYNRRDAGTVALPIYVYNGNANVNFNGNTTSTPGTTYTITGSNLANLTGNLNVNAGARLQLIDDLARPTVVANTGQLYFTGNALSNSFTTSQATNTVSYTNSQLWNIKYVVVGGGGGGGAGAATGGGGGGGEGGQVIEGTYRYIANAASIVSFIGRGGPSQTAGQASTLTIAGTTYTAAAGAAGSTTFGGSPYTQSAAGGTGNPGADGGRGAPWWATSGGGTGTASGGTTGSTTSLNGSYVFGSGGGGGGAGLGTGAGGGTGAGTGGNGGTSGAATAGGSGSNYGSGGGGGGSNNTAGQSGGSGMSGYVQYNYIKSITHSAQITLNGTGYTESGGPYGSIHAGETGTYLTGGVVVQSASSIHVIGNASPLMINSVVSGSGNLTVNGTGYTALNGTHTLSGNVIINGYLGGSGSASSAPHIINTGGTLSAMSQPTLVNANYSIASLVVAASGRYAVYSNGTSTVGVLTVVGAFTINGAWFVDWPTATSAGTYTIIACTGTLPAVLPTTGTNSSGRTIAYNWVVGTGLRAVLT